MKIGTKNIVSKHFGSREVIKEVFNGSVVYTSAPSVDPVLANNSWETIKAVCEAGNASNYWSVGDTKTDVGTDNVTRTMRICDMSGLYSKHVVFEQVECERYTKAWDTNGANDYSTSTIKTTLNSEIKGYYSNDLQSTLTTTTVKVAESGSSSTILDVTDYLFLPAEKEIYGSRFYSWGTEANELYVYEYYSTHNTNAGRVKKINGDNETWWLRSPDRSGTTNATRIANTGSISTGSTSNQYGLAPCFAF